MNHSKINVVGGGKKYLNFIFKSLEIFRLGLKTIFIFFSSGIKGVLRQYEARKLRLKNLSPKNDAPVPDSLPSIEQPPVINPSIEPKIPSGWLDIQRYKPLISIIIPVKNFSCLSDCLDSLTKQVYKNFEVILVCEDNSVAELEKKYSSILNISISHVKNSSCDKWDYLVAGVNDSHGSLLGLLDTEDILTENALFYVVEAFNESFFEHKELFLVPDESSFENDTEKYFDRKVKARSFESLLKFGIFRRESFTEKRSQFEYWLLNLPKEKIHVSNWIACHSTITKNNWNAPRVRALAFYLPQFHAIPENDKWWGKNFTEWTNVKKATPLYPGHHQPRVPSEEIGYYDLGDNGGLDVQKKQIKLAREYGLFGFCYYYYWFDGGKRLLEKPLDRHLKNKELDFPFCICWANENWTRRWDGNDDEVLMPQSYSPGWDEKFFMDLLPYIKDSRYLKVNGAPFILIYKARKIPQLKQAIYKWKKLARENGIPLIHVSAVRWTPESSELEYSGYSLDSLTDFPPHNSGRDINSKEFNNGHIFDYRKVRANQTKILPQDYVYFRSVMLEWDNTARRRDSSDIFEHFSFKEYRKWLYMAKYYVLRNNRPDENLIFINAWNEWGEGTYLEPSEKYGRQALEETQEILESR